LTAPEAAKPNAEFRHRRKGPPGPPDTTLRERCGRHQPAKSAGQACPDEGEIGVPVEGAAPRNIGSVFRRLDELWFLFGRRKNYDFVGIAIG
jgi:hypothetical protein